MAKLYYRGMANNDGQPKLGRSARCLGVRLGVDIDIEQLPAGYLDAAGYLLLSAEQTSVGEVVSVALKNTKGMSVALSIEGLPYFRKPPEFGGLGKDPIWQIDDSYITGDLEALQDSSTHVSVLPRVTMRLETYEAALAKTQSIWQRVN